MIGRLFRFVGLAVGWVLIAATGTSVWLHYYASRGDYAVYLTSAVPFAVVAGVLAVLLLLGLRAWFTAAIAVAATLVVGYTQAPLFVADTAGSGPDVVVVSANLMLGEADVDALARQVGDAQTDILSLQEVTPQAMDRIRRSPITQQLRYVHAIPESAADGTALLSRFPLTDTGEIDGLTLRNLTARADLPHAPGAHLLAVHPRPPTRGQSADWAGELDWLHRRIDALGSGPLIAAGDFNATWDHAAFRALLTNGVEDATDQAGAGFLPTYPTDKVGHRPVFAIDHVVVRGFVATSVHTFDLAGSDHRGIVVRLRTGG